MSKILLKFGVCTKCANGTKWSYFLLCTSNFGRPYLSRPNSVSGVLELYGKPIESRLFPYSCGRQWVITNVLKIYGLHQLCGLLGCVSVNSQVLT